MFAAAELGGHCPPPSSEPDACPKSKLFPTDVFGKADPFRGKSFSGSSAGFADFSHMSKVKLCNRQTEEQRYRCRPVLFVILKDGQKSIRHVLKADAPTAELKPTN